MGRSGVMHRPKDEAVKPLQRTLGDMRERLRLEREWHVHLRRALDRGYLIEASYGSVQQIHTVLHHTLWLDSHLRTIEGRLKAPEYAGSILRHPDRMEPAEASDAELHAAASRQGILGEVTARELSSLMLRLPALVRGHPPEVLSGGTALEDAAKKLLTVAHLCLKRMEREIEEGEGMMV